MRDVWLISDTHFGHRNIIRYGERPFSTVEEMDRALVERWAGVVKPDHKVYHLGDVGGRSATELGRYMDALPGRKVLIKGNHDTLSLSAYQAHFKDVRATHLLGTGRDDVTHLLLSHVPVHQESIKVGWVNVHGHRHQKGSPEGPYLSVSVEMVGYTPVSLEWVIGKAKEVV